MGMEGNRGQGGGVECTGMGEDGKGGGKRRRGRKGGKTQEVVFRVSWLGERRVIGENSDTRCKGFFALFCCSFKKRFPEWDQFLHRVVQDRRLIWGAHGCRTGQDERERERERGASHGCDEKVKCGGLGCGLQAFEWVLKVAHGGSRLLGTGQEGERDGKGCGRFLEVLSPSCNGGVREVGNRLLESVRVVSEEGVC